jgi:A/G-specific adenine glycosylase
LLTAETRKSPNRSYDENGLANQLLSWYRRHYTAYPWRTRFQETGDPYFVWISEIMLQQTTVAAVAPKFTKFIERFPNAQKLTEADEEDILLMCSGLGYYRRFRQLKKTLAYFAQLDLSTTFPTDFDTWLEAPGIGPYTASAVTSIAFNNPVAAVDANWDRVVARLFAIKESLGDTATKKQIRKLAAQILDHEDPGSFNQAIMELGQQVCRTKSPNCEICPVKTHCAAFAKGLQNEIPRSAEPKLWKNVRLQVFVPRKGDAIGLAKRTTDSFLLRGTTGFPLAADAPDISLRSLGSFKHTITDHKITAEVHFVEDDQMPLSWHDYRNVNEELLTTFDKKAWAVAQKFL